MSATAAIRSSLLLALVLALVGCDPAPEPSAPEPPPTQSSSGHCRRQSFEGSAFTVCRYDPTSHSLELVVDGPGGPLRSFDALERHLGSRAERLLFAMNAGMYDEAGMPIGLYVENGRLRHRLNLRDGPGNFHMKPNGVFAVGRDGRVSVVRGEAARNLDALWATQSGPMLVTDGALHPSFQANGESRMIRNGVGVSDPRTAWFVISDEAVSFGRFARLFHDGLGCPNALFFDGSVSSLWDPGAGRRDGYSSLGPMVAVFSR